MFSWAKFPIGLGLCLCYCPYQPACLNPRPWPPGGRGGPSLKTSDLPSRAMWYELFSWVASA